MNQSPASLRTGKDTLATPKGFEPSYQAARNSEPPAILKDDRHKGIRTAELRPSVSVPAKEHKELEQPPLFSTPVTGTGPYGRPLPEAPYVKGSETSKAAALAQTRVKLNRGQQKVLKCIKESGDFGRTDEEGIFLLDISPSTYRPRRGELADLELIIQKGKRKLRSGLEGAVWIVNPVPPTPSSTGVRVD